MKAFIIILGVAIILSLATGSTVSNDGILYQGITSQDIGVAFMFFTLALLMRNSDKK